MVYLCGMELKKLAALLLLLPLMFASCNKEDQFLIDEGIILEYIEANNLDALSTDDGLYYVIIGPGTGVNATINDEVTVDYEGFLLDGTKFDSSIDRGTPATFPLTGVIRGWQLGIPLVKEGGTITLLIPSELAYGKNPPAGSVIPKDAVLRFEVDVIEVG